MDFQDGYLVFLTEPSLCTLGRSDSGAFFLYGPKYAVLNLNGLMGNFSTCIYKEESLQLSDWNFSTR